MKCGASCGVSLNDGQFNAAFEKNKNPPPPPPTHTQKSDLLVQIVDARNPLLFRCTDVESYVREISPKKKNLLLINKSDLLSEEQRYCQLFSF